MRRFAQALVRVAPEADGSPIQLYQSERTVIRAFIVAGVLAVVAIGIILWAVLRRVGDVLLTLVPLLVAGLVTLELMVLLGISLNFANVIALPLLSESASSSRSTTSWPGAAAARTCCINPDPGGVLQRADHGHRLR